MMKLFAVAEEGGNGQLHVCSSEAAVRRLSATSPVVFGGDESAQAASGADGRAYELAGDLKAGEVVFAVKVSSGGCCLLVPGIFADRAAADALVKARKSKGGVVVAIAIEG